MLLWRGFLLPQPDGTIDIPLFRSAVNCVWVRVHCLRREGSALRRVHGQLPLVLS
jgi:hypothetical protein